MSNSIGAVSGVSSYGSGYENNYNSINPNQKGAQKGASRSGSIVDETYGMNKLTSLSNSKTEATKGTTATPLGSSQILDSINQSSYSQLLEYMAQSSPYEIGFGQYSKIYDPYVSPNYFTSELALNMFELFNMLNNPTAVATSKNEVSGGSIMHEQGYFEEYLQDYKDPVIRNLAYSIIGNETDPDLVVDKIHQFLIGDANLQNGENGYDYISDVDNPLHPGLSEYWNTARKFLDGPGGDCEDFAIAAMNLLLAASEMPGLQGKLNPNDFRIYAVLANDGSTISEDGVVSNERLGGHAFFAYRRKDGTWVQVDGTFLPSLLSVKDRRPLSEEPNYFKAMYFFDKNGAVFEKGNMRLLDRPNFPFAGHQQQMAATSFLAAQRALNNPDGFIGRNIAVSI